MSNTFLNTIKEIISELDGIVFYPKNDLWYDLGLAFCLNGEFRFDHLDLKVSVKDRRWGVNIKSQITNEKYVQLETYVFLLVDWLEKEFGMTISLKPTTSRSYFTGELLNQKIKILK